MSLCRYLPVPSDRMAIIWSLLTVEDSIILEYGPAGTTHFSMGLYGALGADVQQRLFTTHMSEDDVVMGDVTRLEEAIVELDKNYGPKVIFVIASSVSSVIGTDLKGVCRYMQQEVKCRLIAFEQGGIRGDYSTGLQEVCKLLVNNLTEPAQAEQGTYNILGASIGRYRMASDIWEVSSLLREAFGLKKRACLCCATSADEIAGMGAAQLNIVLGAEGLPAAEILREKFGTPYVYCVPYGYQGTLQFLKRVGEVLGRMPAMHVMARIGGKMRGVGMLMMYGMMGGRRKPPQAAVRGDYDLVCGLSKFLESAGLKVEHKICTHSLKNIAGPEEGVIHYSVEKDWLTLFASLQKTLVFADDIALLQCGSSNTKVRVSMPFLYGSQRAEHLPFMGEKGADFLLEYIEAYYQSQA